MWYKLLHEHTELPLIDRLLSVRGVFDTHENFLNPRLHHHRGDPFDLNDMDKGTDLLIQAMKDRKSLCIFWDYDVDGVTSSYLMYLLLSQYLKYPKVKIMYPDRLKDGYGMKTHHIDAMKSAGHDVIITVDNGITSIQEALYAKQLGMQMIITDHHKALEILPEADALINPQVSNHYDFKGLCGAGVVLKFANALLKKSKLAQEQQQSILSHFIPIVAIATVADCVPLLWENRAIVKRGLSQMTRRKDILPSLEGLLNFVNITGPLKSHHIWFIIGPRINAWGRLATGYDSLKTLLFHGEKQIQALKHLDNINDQRKLLQKNALEMCLEQINIDDPILIGTDSSFHEGIVWIVAGRITEKYNKPSIVLHISTEKDIAVGSLRGPEYFDVMAMMQRIQKQSHGKGMESDKWILIRFGGHKQAGGLTVHLNDLDLLKQLAKEYTHSHTTKEQSKKIINVDTILHWHEWTDHTLAPLEHMEPFGNSNEEPIFVLQNTHIQSIETVGNRGKWHLKLSVNHEGKLIDALYWSKGDRIDDFTKGASIDIIGKVKFDNYKQTHFIDGILSKEE